MATQPPPPHWLIVGLGNPGKQYDDTPHNVGFAVVDRVAEALGASPWKLDKKAKASVCATDDGTVVLAKPQTYMNESGTAVKSLLYRGSGESPQLVLIHDELALSLGEIRVGRFESSAGHNGVQSVIKYIGIAQKLFVRVRVGVLPPGGQPSPAEEYVTAKWQLRTDERALVAPAIQRAAEATVELLSAPLPNVQNRYN